eukprot:CAMPEP_0198223026 /NCGR_PEP_ID=MMETSP1445-20131203/90650_1 /TAXON_ID=36898 /ORGANISM="Pyramimonas sp., Strain CCMP2087" /LENGTH=33 /DNA_ID= /DNA_START= /DNA_END= /DNA_ORIENTATION=
MAYVACVANMWHTCGKRVAYMWQTCGIRVAYAW